MPAQSCELRHAYNITNHVVQVSAALLFLMLQHCSTLLYLMELKRERDFAPQVPRPHQRSNYIPELWQKFTFTLLFLKQRRQTVLQSFLILHNLFILTCLIG